jgi:hypothetical protein
MKKTMTYDIGNPGPGLGQAQRCGGLSRLLGYQPSPVDNLYLQLITYAISAYHH